MKDSTKIKLINSLIETVEHFYDQKSKYNSDKAKHLKGFCEGIAYTLVQMGILNSVEATEILKGLGKKRAMIKEEKLKEITKKENLDIPTIFRKQKKIENE
jgi:hypothetical protein